ncbi:hypothetical protein BJY01DRAFT_205798 [Aspergillus pseudoustus]|uniref:DUF4160 domain-containing protein n=1 Tax=Aspergillus pseudoustus TaxID=1810923 RepID=A0ABR4KPS0_9EURO
MKQTTLFIFFPSLIYMLTSYHPQNSPHIHMRWNVQDKSRENAFHFTADGHVFFFFLASKLCHLLGWSARLGQEGKEEKCFYAYSEL